jgi:nucleolar protein 58
MHLLFETPAGYSLFKITDEKKLSKTSEDDLHDKFFADASKAKKYVNLIHFEPFSDTADAVTAAAACIDGKVPKSLKSFLKKQLKKSGKGDSLAILDKNLVTGIKEAVPNLPCSLACDAKTHELFRGIRCYLDELMESDGGDDKEEGGPAVSEGDLTAMRLGLSHSLSRYKLKFSSDKVDTMVIQAIGLLDELDKEINTYAMRVKEWYGWHFPELQGIVNDNAQYSKLVLTCGYRSKFRENDLSQILEEESIEAAVKEAAEVSMGTEISDLDIINIQSLAEQVLSMTEYRIQLFDYLKNRMNAIAPNLTILLGELVAARLISHSGSLMNLAKQPASTVQILGAEKALFRALKTKHDTPKYGLIYHASLVGQAAPKHKGKISRVLAAKAALATRVDALSDETTEHPDTTIGYEGRAKVEARLRQLEGGDGTVILANKDGKLSAAKTAKYEAKAAKSSAVAPGYNESSDMVLDGESEKKKAKKEKKKKRKAEDIEEEAEEAEAEVEKEPKKKKSKKEKKAKKEKKKSKD